MAPKKQRLYARLRFSDSHIKAHKCRACREPVKGAYVAAVYRGGRGNWLFDPFHPRCANEADEDLARALLSERAGRFDEAAEALRGVIGAAPPDPSSRSLAEQPYRDTGELYRFGAASDPCGLCNEPIEGLAIVRPRQDRGVTTEVGFHFRCAANTRGFDWDHFLDRARNALAGGSLDADALADALAGVAPPTVADALRGEPARAGATVHGADRKRATRDQLRWDLYFAGPVAPTAVEALLDGDASWEASAILTLRPSGKTSTAAFRDQLLAALDALSALGLRAASFCGAGDAFVERAESLAAAGVDPPFPFAFVGRGQHPGPDFRVRVRFAGAAPALDDDALDSRFFVEPRAVGHWLSFRARYAVAPDAPFQDAIRRDLDALLVALHAEHPIDVAILGDATNTGDGDAWHAHTVARRDLSALFAEAPAPAPATLSDAELTAICTDAEREHALACEMGDPESGRAILDDILARIPVAHAAERKKIQALIDDLLS